MQDILKEYGPAIITVVAVISLVTVVSAVIGSDENGIVGTAFTELMKKFFTAEGGLSTLK